METSSSNSSSSTIQGMKRKFCTICEIPDTPGHSRTLHHRNMLISSSRIDDGVELVHHAFKNRISIYRLKSLEFPDSNNIKTFMDSVRFKSIQLIKDMIKIHSSVKVNVELFGQYVQPAKEDDGDIISSVKSFNVKF